MPNILTDGSGGGITTMGTGNTLLGENIISLLKAGYASDPNNKTWYHDLADMTRSIFGVTDYGSDQILDTTKSGSLDQTELSSLVSGWLKSTDPKLKGYAAGLVTLGITTPAVAPTMPGVPAVAPTMPGVPAVAVPTTPTAPEQEAINYATAGTNFYGNQLNAEEIKARNDLNAQQARYQSLLGSNWVNGILTQLGQLQVASIDSVNKMAELAKQSVTAQAGAARTQVNADYIGVIDEIKQAANEARQMKNEDLNARGMYFSSVLTDALDKISVAEIQTIGKTEGQRVAKLAQIAANLVTATANVDIETIKSNSNIATQYGLQKLALISQDAKDKAGYEAILAGLEVQTKGVTDYYATLKEGLPAYQQMKEYEVLAPIKAAEAESAYKKAQDTYQREQDRIHNEVAQGYLTVAQGNLRIAGLNYDLAVAKFNTDQDPNSFANVLETQKVLVSEGNLAITTKYDEARIKEIDANIKNKNAETWRILHPIIKETATGTMDFTDAKGLLALQLSLTKTAAGGVDYWGNPATSESIELARQQLVLYGSSFLIAQARIIAEDDPEQANAIIATQQYIYQQFGVTSDYDLDQYSVKQLYDSKISLDKYPKAKTIIGTWIMGLPQVYLGHG